MSLINKVLKDLESRRGQSADTGGLRAADVPGARRDWPRWFIALAVAITLGVTLFVADELLRKRAEVVQEADVVEPEPGPAAVVTTPEPVTTDPPVESSDPVIAEDSPTESPVKSAEPEPEPVVQPPARTSATRERAEPARTEPAPARVEPQPQPLERTLRTTSPRQRADDAYSQGVRALTEGRRAEAERQFRAALGHDPTLHAARLALANLLVSNGQTREAEVQLQQGLRLAPNASELADRYARLLLDRGDLGGAIGVLSDSPPPLIAEPEYHALLAALLQRAGHHQGAADKYAALVEHAPDRSLWWVGLGISLEALARGPAALEAYRRAVNDPRLAGDVLRFVNTRIGALEDAAADGAR